MNAYYTSISSFRSQQPEDAHIHWGSSYNMFHTLNNQEISKNIVELSKAVRLLQER